MNIPSAIPDKLKLDADGRIAEDIYCRRCGYNLRTLDPNGICPECGTAVGRSVHGNLLRFCDPTWVGNLASGMNWILVGIISQFLIAPLAGISGAFWVRGTAPASASLFVLIGIGPALVTLIGLWKATSPDPGRLEQEHKITARQLVRITCLISFLAQPVSLLLDQLDTRISSAAGLLAGAIGLIGTFAIFTYARQLALRIPDEGLAKQTRIVMWGLVAIGLVCLLAEAATLIFLLVAGTSTPLTFGPAGLGVGPGPTASGTIPPVTTAPEAPSSTPISPPETSGTASATTGAPGQPPTTFPSTRQAMRGLGLVVLGISVAVAMCVVGAAYLGFGIWALVLTILYRQHLRAAARLASETWSRTPQSQPPADIPRGD